MKTSTKIWLAAGSGLLAVVGILVGVKAAQIGKMIAAGKSFTLPPESVSSAKVEASEWQPTQAAIGSVVAVRGVTLGAELTGRVQEVGFDSGASVRKGAVLAKLDTSLEEAQLAAARADAKLARLTLQRARGLRTAGANTEAELQAAEARGLASEAAVASLDATIAKKTIRAPFDGRVSIRQVELGQVVSPGTPIARLQSVDPIYVEFSLPQQALASVKEGQKVHATLDTFPGASWDGRVTTINAEVDAATRNVRIRATLPNADGRLRPGMFAKVEVLDGDKRPVLAIPATAVIFAPFGDSVFVLEPKKGSEGRKDLVALQKFVRLGERRGDVVAVVSGLSAGETVAGSGAFKLRNGAAVVVHDELAPKVELAPHPADQ